MTFIITNKDGSRTQYSNYYDEDDEMGVDAAWDDVYAKFPEAILIMASNSPTLMQSEERFLDNLNTDIPLEEEDYTICFCISKQISTTNIEDICRSLQNRFLDEGWSIDDFDLEKE